MAEPLKVYIVTINDRYGAETAVFSTEAKADAHAFQRARKIWQERRHEPEMPEADDSEFWTAFYEALPDTDIEQDHAVVDEP